MEWLLSAGMIFSMLMVLAFLVIWPNKTLTGVTPVSALTLIAILFTSGLDVGLIMFPLTEFPVYADIGANPEYAFTNPFAIEFGFWGFLVWAIYFLTCFYFCALEPKIRFFEKPWVNRLNSTIIVVTCAFTAYLLLNNLSWYLPSVAATDNANWYFAAIVGFTILAAVYSSTDIKYVKMLSLASSGLFILLVVGLAAVSLTHNNIGVGDYVSTLAQLEGYFSNLHKFILPINDYHAFYLFWWFAWSIMIGQFTARFVGGMKTWVLFANMLIWPSLSIALWFSVLYLFYRHDISVSGLINIAMVTVGVIFVINSLDSLLRVYSDNLQLSPKRLGRLRYILLQFSLLAGLVTLFKLEFLKIQWIGALVILLIFVCAGFAANKMLRSRTAAVADQG